MVLTRMGALAVLLFGCTAGGGGFGTTESGSGGKADLGREGAVTDVFECTVDRGGRIEVIELEVLGATMTRTGNQMALSLETRDLSTEEARTYDFAGSDQMYEPTVDLTYMAAGWELDAEESPFFDVRLRLKSDDGVTYTSEDTSGMQLDFTPPFDVTCARGEAPPLSPADRLALHVTSNLETISAAGASHLGIHVDEIDVKSETLRCMVQDHFGSLPGHDAPPGTCLITGFSHHYAINVGIDYEAEAPVYTWSVLVVEQ